jgi:hypothetical protein
MYEMYEMYEGGGNMRQEETEYEEVHNFRALQYVE